MSTLAIFVLIVVFPTSKVGTSHFIDRDNAFEEILNNEDFSRFGYLTISSTLDILKFFYGKKNSLQLYNLVKTQLAETDPASGDCVKIYNKTFVYLPDLTPSSYYLLTSRESYFLQPFVVVFVATVFEPFEYAEFSPDKVYLTDSEYEASGHRWYKLSESYVRSLVDLIDDEDLATEICAQDPTGTCMPNKVKSWIYQQNKDLVFETFAGLLQVTTLLYNGDGREPSIRETSSAALNALNLMQSDCMSTSYLHRSELISAGSLAGKVFGDSLQMSKLFTSFNNRSASYAAHNNGSMLSCPKLDVNNSTTSGEMQYTLMIVNFSCFHDRLEHQKHSRRRLNIKINLISFNLET